MSTIKLSEFICEVPMAYKKNLKICFCAGKAKATTAKVLPAQVLIFLAQVRDRNSAHLPLTPPC